MKPVEQTKTGPEEGNCFAACLASILECSIDEVPNPHGGEDWLSYFGRVQRWLMKRGLFAITTRAGHWSTGCVHMRYPGFSILSADSPRHEGTWHAVVWSAGEVVWDPHPQREMGIGNPQEMTFLLTLFPEAATVSAATKSAAERLRDYYSEEIEKWCL